MTLNQLPPGGKAVVTQIGTDPALEARLRDFGLIPGTVVLCRYRSSGKDLSALQLRGSVIAMRARDLIKIAARRC